MTEHGAEQRERELARMRAYDARDARRVQDRAHLPGSGEHDIFDRLAYWDRATDSAETRWDGADRALRYARASYGEFPDTGEAVEIAALEAEREQWWAERQRCRGHRDQALTELEGWR